MFHQLQFSLNFLLTIPFFASSEGQNGPIASTQYGELQGLTFETVRGTVNAWLGIPYAAPPTGSARFEVCNQISNLTYFKIPSCRFIISMLCCIATITAKPLVQHSIGHSVWTTMPTAGIISSEKWRKRRLSFSKCVQSS